VGANAAAGRAAAGGGSRLEHRLELEQEQE